MNCHKVKKYLFAFADSQLSVQANCEVLDHLKMCPTCSAIVDEHQGIRRAIARSAEKIRVPAGLESKIRYGIETGGAMKSLNKSAGHERKFSILRVSALAACLLAGVGLVWHFSSGGSLTDLESFAGAGATTVGGLTPADQVTQDVVVQHNKCLLRCDMDAHHNSDLPRERTDVASAVDQHFANAVAAAAPDLSGYGFDFESANFCNPTEDKSGPAAHVMYVNYSNSSRISMFTVPHWASFELAGGGTADRQSPFINSTGGCDNNAMLAWNEGEMTYILVGQLDVERMAEMIRSLTLTEATLLDSSFASALMADASK